MIVSTDFQFVALDEEVIPRFIEPVDVVPVVNEKAVIDGIAEVNADHGGPLHIVIARRLCLFDGDGAGLHGGAAVRSEGRGDQQAARSAVESAFHPRHAGQGHHVERFVQDLGKRERLVRAHRLLEIDLAGIRAH